MLYLKNFQLLSREKEYCVVDLRKIFNNYYPLGIFTRKELSKIDFSDITIFYGGNGSGKTTLLNIIADKLQAKRNNQLDKGVYFYKYVQDCLYKMNNKAPFEIKIITSDDVFEYLLSIRAINSGINIRKEELTQDYLDKKYNPIDYSIHDYHEIKLACESRHKTMSKYIRDQLHTNNIIEQSNGESALMFWEKEIEDNGIYLLDEPENSLSAENQLKLKQFIEDSARFYNCQFIIATHSPFLLNLANAKIYDLDTIPVQEKKWTELKNVRIYHEFFKEHDHEFTND